jgi:hypothetical protein
VAENEQMPEVVYHYTSMDTLLKIVDTGTIWSTNIRYLNDILERKHYFDMIARRLPHVMAGYPELSNRWQEFGDSDDDERDFDDLPFVASFSEDRDSLSQWRSYCPGGNGVCIGFRTESIIKSHLNLQDAGPHAYPFLPNVSFQRVNYLLKEHVGQIDKCIKDAISAAEWMKAATDSDNDDRFPPVDIAPCLRYSFSKSASLFKHGSFASECEYRLLAFGFGELVKYRSSRTTLVPYIPLHIPHPEPSEGEDYRYQTSFIESVTIGPTPNKALSKGAVSGMFQGRREHVVVETSDVPFRDL